MKIPALFSAAAALAAIAPLGAAPVIGFDTRTLSTEFHAEGAAVGDFDRDGAKDVVSGPYIYFGPDFKRSVAIYEPTRFDVRAYSKNFLCYVGELNGDGYDDVVVMGFPGDEGYWFENPKNGTANWKRHVVFKGLDNESPTFADITGDGKPEIVCSYKEQWGYAEPNWSDPTQEWRFTPVSAVIPGMGRFTHGLGLGDVNGDGRMDLLSKDGWLEQPADRRTQPVWKVHPFKFGTGGSQMFAYDFDGDGDNDVLTSLAAHGFGLSWFENTDGKGDAFTEHLIIGEDADTSPTKVAFSQHHSVDMADFDGDGVLDFVTGKRWFAHNGGDPGGMDPGVTYVFRTVRQGGPGKVAFEPVFIHDDSGVGTQVMATDVNGDKLPDVVVGNKKGTFVHLQTRPTADGDGLVPLFDGKTLAGWEGDAKFWRVADGGVVTAESTKDNPLDHNTFLLWRAGRLADFELRLSFRLTGVPDANSGIQFRCQDLGNFKVKGYQADINAAGDYAGVLWDEEGRGLLGPHGVRAVHDKAGNKTETRFADAAAVKAAYKPGDWNDYTIVASGEHITLRLNGVVTTQVIDRTYTARKPDGAPVDDKQPKEERELYGHLALQLHAGGATKVEFKNVRLRALPGAVQPIAQN